MSTFNYDQIMNAINKIQEAHPVSFAYDATSFEDLEAVDAIKSVIDKAIEQAEKNSEIHIICELAKNYMIGVKPTYGIEKSQWIPCSKYIPNEPGYYLTSTCNNQVYCDYWNGCYFDRTELVIAWMPLPEPFRKEGAS